MPAGRPKKVPKNALEMVQVYVEEVKKKQKALVLLRKAKREGMIKRLKATVREKTISANRAKCVLYAELNRLMELDKGDV